MKGGGGPQKEEGEGNQAETKKKIEWDICNVCDVLPSKCIRFHTTCWVFLYPAHVMLWRLMHVVLFVHTILKYAQMILWMFCWFLWQIFVGEKN